MRPLRSNASRRGERSETQGMHDYVILNGARPTVILNGAQRSEKSKVRSVGIPRSPPLNLPLERGRGKSAKGDDRRGVSRNAPTFLRWIPASAGMT